MGLDSLALSKKKTLTLNLIHKNMVVGDAYKIMIMGDAFENSAFECQLEVNHSAESAINPSILL